MTEKKRRMKLGKLLRKQYGLPFGLAMKMAKQMYGEYDPTRLEGLPYREFTRVGGKLYVEREHYSHYLDGYVVDKGQLEFMGKEYPVKDDMVFPAGA